MRIELNQVNIACEKDKAQKRNKQKRQQELLWTHSPWTSKSGCPAIFFRQSYLSDLQKRNTANYGDKAMRAAFKREKSVPLIKALFVCVSDHSRYLKGIWPRPPPTVRPLRRQADSRLYLTARPVRGGTDLILRLPTPLQKKLPTSPLLFSSQPELRLPATVAVPP